MAFPLKIRRMPSCYNKGPSYFQEIRYFRNDCVSEYRQFLVEDFQQVRTNPLMILSGFMTSSLSTKKLIFFLSLNSNSFI